MKFGLHKGLIQATSKSRQMKVSRYLLRQVSRIWSSIAKVLRKLSSNKELDSKQKLDQSNRCRGAIEDAGAFSIDPLAIEEMSRLHLRKMLEKLDIQQGIKEVLSQLFKTVFRDVKSTDMNAIQHTTQPMIQSTQKSLKIVSQFKNFEHKEFQNTHTLNKSNQFYISKISHDSLVSIHCHM